MPTEILAFYKGTPFPFTFGMDLKDWTECKKSWDECIVVGLRCGVCLKTQIKDYFEQLNQIESFLQEWYGEKRNKEKKKCKTNDPVVMTAGLQKQLKKDIKERFGQNYDTIQAIWYMNIHMLMKMKQLEDNNDNGWIIIQKNK